MWELPFARLTLLRSTTARRVITIFVTWIRISRQFGWGSTSILPGKIRKNCIFQPTLRMSGLFPVHSRSNIWSCVLHWAYWIQLQHSQKFFGRMSLCLCGYQPLQTEIRPLSVLLMKPCRAPMTVWQGAPSFIQTFAATVWTQMRWRNGALECVDCALLGLPSVKVDTSW